MTGCMEFDYYYGIEAEQFSFYRVPRVLIKDERFRGLSSDAKLLYGLMLDRMSLSMKNGWLDGQNRAYIYYTLENVMEDLGCCRDKCVKILAELDGKKGIGLIEKKRQGLGRPDIIYVKNFATIEAEKRTDNADGAGPDIKMSAQAGNVACKDVSEAQGSISEADIFSQIGGSFDADVSCRTVESSDRSVSEEGVSCFNGDAVIQAEDFVDRGVYAQFMECNGALYEPVKMQSQDAEKQICRSQQNRLAEVGKTDLQKSVKRTSGSQQNRRMGIDGDFIEESSKQISRNRQNRLAEVGRTDLQKSVKQTSGSRQNGFIEVGKTDLQKSEKQISGSRQNGFAEVGKADSNYTDENYTEWSNMDINYTDRNYIEQSNTEISMTEQNKREDNYTGLSDINPINPISSSNQSRISSVYPSCRELDRTDKMAEAERYMRLIKENIEYDHFMQYGNTRDRELFENLYGVICSVVCADCETVRISGALYPHEMVKSRFLKLNRSHIEYVICCLGKNTNAVYNINEYMKTSLFNAPNTMDSYYQQAVQHDMYGGGWVEKGVI